MSENKAETGSKGEENWVDPRPDHFEIFSIRRTIFTPFDEAKSPKELRQQIEEEMLDLGNDLGRCANSIRSCLDKIYKEGEKSMEEKGLLWAHVSAMAKEIADAQPKAKQAYRYWVQEHKKELALKEAKEEKANTKARTKTKTKTKSDSKAKNAK